MIDKLIEQQETIKSMQENEESAIKIMKMYEDYKLRVDKAIEYIEKNIEELKHLDEIGYKSSTAELRFNNELLKMLKGESNECKRNV